MTITIWFSDYRDFPELSFKVSQAKFNCYIKKIKETKTFEVYQTIGDYDLNLLYR